MVASAGVVAEPIAVTTAPEPPLSAPIGHFAVGTLIAAAIIVSVPELKLRNAQPAGLFQGVPPFAPKPTVRYAASALIEFSVAPAGTTKFMDWTGPGKSPTLVSMPAVI